MASASEQVNEREAADPRARALAAELDKTETDIKSKQARKAAIAAELEDVGAFGNVFSATLTEEIRNPKPNTPGVGEDAGRAARAARGAGRGAPQAGRRAARPAADRGQAPPPAGPGRRRAASAPTARRAVTIGCRALPQVTATVSYVVGGASWQPEYDVDVAPARPRQDRAGASPA